MHARVGDWLVVESARLDRARRTGKVIEVRHPDGSPPYLIHWLDTDDDTLTVPGPDARILTDAEYQAQTHR